MIEALPFSALEVLIQNRLAPIEFGQFLFLVLKCPYLKTPLGTKRLGNEIARTRRLDFDGNLFPCSLHKIRRSYIHAEKKRRLLAFAKLDHHFPQSQPATCCQAQRYISLPNLLIGDFGCPLCCLTLRQMLPQANHTKKNETQHAQHAMSRSLARKDFSSRLKRPD